MRSCPSLTLPLLLLMSGSSGSAQIIEEGELRGYVVLPLQGRAEIARHIKEFDDNLRYIGLGGQIRSCEHMVDVTEGRVSSNHSYGAICELKDRQRKATILVCHDRIVGHFALKTGPFRESREETASFAVRNCTGG